MTTAEKSILLFDSPVSEDHFLYKGLLEYKLDLIKIDSPNKHSLIKNWIIGSIRAINATDKDDLIICWYDFQAIICFWYCLLFFKRRKIVAINLLLKNKKTGRNKLVSLLYKQALQSKNVKASVTSVEYGEELKKQLSIDVKLFLIRDVYPYKEFEEGKFVDCGKNVFCGGNNGRDWNTVIEVAKKMPDVKFNLVMPKQIADSMNMISLDNLHIETNVSLERFNSLLCSSSIVILPLDTDAPAGLIVLFYAASQQKLVITTSTPVTREYINTESGVLLSHNADDYVKTLNYYLNNKEEIKKKAEALQQYIKENCSQEKFIHDIYNLIKTKWE